MGNQAMDEQSVETSLMSPSVLAAKGENLVKISTALDNGDNLKGMKFKMAYKGISKKDIMQRPTKEVFSKIQSNLLESQKYVNQMRLNRLKNRMEVETNYSKIKTQFE